MSKDGALFIWHSEIVDSDPADNALPKSDNTSSKKKLKKGLYKWMKHAKYVITSMPLNIAQ